mmetsp:Transcript_146807/g.366107  ORF Transcript_146807/g.366107 Transcript_146807/m.366107 type:complete len:512 (+) Transcript_146807:57-1592(+)
MSSQEPCKTLPSSAKAAEKSAEFEREPVPDRALKHWTSFLAIFAGRHTAGTEFSIGPLFIVHGATAVDVVLGLFVGNVLATLSWRFLCAPIAVRNRLTTFYMLERIVGVRATAVYSIFVGTLLALVAGAMFAVSGTAVGVLFDVPMPGLHDWLPSSWAWVAVVATVGAVTAIVAAFGYRYVSLFSKVVTPYMFAVIVFMGVESLRLLHVETLDDFWTVANTKIWAGHSQPGFGRYGFFHCVCSAWFCDLLLHAAMNDLTILRYAKTSNIGWLSSVGMFAGHYFTWIVAGFLYAVQLDSDPSNTSVAPGPMAKAVAGVNGLICVILAGWSTANPILYEAGLAFQSVFGPGWQTRSVTLFVGALASLAGIFPALVMRILDLLAFGGLVALPLGVVIMADCTILPALGFDSEHCEAMKGRGKESATNWPAVAAWLLMNAVCLPLVLSGTLAVFFAPLLGAPIAGFVYILGAMWRDRVASRAQPEGDQKSGCASEIASDDSHSTETPESLASEVV